MASPTGSSQPLSRAIELNQTFQGLEAFNRKLTRDDFRSIYQHLTHHSRDWYSIGAHLVSLAILDKIDADHGSVSHKMIRMLSSWLDNAEDCTWRTLITALKEEGHVGVARSIVRYVSEGEFALNEPPRTPPDNPWEKMKELICTKEQQFHLELLSVEDLQNRHMKSFREMLCVRPDVSDDQMLADIVYFFFHECKNKANGDESLVLFDRLSNNFSDISKNLYFKSLCLLVELLVAHLKEVNESLQNLAAQKESLKESMFQLEVGTDPCRQQSRDDHVRILEQRTRNRTRARDISQQVQDAVRYRQYLSDKLDNSTKHLNKAMRQNRIVGDAIISSTIAYKKRAFLGALLFLISSLLEMQFYLLLVIVVIGLFGMLWLKNINSYKKRKIYIFIGAVRSRFFSRKFAESLLGVPVGMMTHLIRGPPLPASHEPPPVWHEPLYVFVKIWLIFHACAVLGFSGANVVLSIKGRVWKFWGVLAFSIFAVDLMALSYWLASWHESWFGEYVAVLGIPYGIYHALPRNIKGHIYYTTIVVLSGSLLAAIRIGSWTAQWIVYDYMGPVSAIVSSALAGAIVPHCFWWLFSRIHIPYFFTNSKMTDAARLLQDNISKLKQMEVNIVNVKKQTSCYT